MVGLIGDTLCHVDVCLCVACGRPPPQATLLPCTNYSLLAQYRQYSHVIGEHDDAKLFLDADRRKTFDPH